MKIKNCKKILLSIIFIFTAGLSYGVNPEYILTAGNAVQTGSNSLEFDIRMIHTNSAISDFEYAGGQYFFDFNLNISNGGALNYSVIESDLPELLQPRNPVVFVTGGEMQLRLSLNIFPSPGQGYIISDQLPGTRIARMKLMTNSESFDVQYFSLRWRNGPVNPFTKIYSFENSQITEVTNSGSHYIDSLTNPLPVELASFSSAVSGNKVTLNWATVNEMNNAGFEIQRKVNSYDTFRKIGFVNGAGNSSEIQNYLYSDLKLQPGNYFYRLKQTDYNGNFVYYDLENKAEVLSPLFNELKQNYPNPFNPQTKIDYQLSSESVVFIKIFDILGKEISVIVNEYKSPGYYTVFFDGSNLPGGVYYYLIRAGGFIDSKRMIILK
ncbi:MAG: T9SS type A sorting domain-containing protein [Ignavibacteria bacterium]|nr:T9SS type A sorting domain-containing protein [Ignavibacteria bacterium]